MKRPTVAIGIAYFGNAHGDWWSNLSNFTANIHREGVDFAGILASGTMATDHNRNMIAKSFLENTNAEWLLWLDYDNLAVSGGLSRLLGLGKTLASGLYYQKLPPYHPNAYERQDDNGAFSTLRDLSWIRGEVVQVDAVGMGFLLTHRSVYEDIQKNFVPVQIYGGGTTLVHKEDIRGTLPKSKQHHSDGKVIQGQLRLRVMEPRLTNFRFPFFMMQYLRTEDLFFFDNAARVGHKPWVDTSIEVPHQTTKNVTGEDWRNTPIQVVRKPSEVVNESP